VICLPRLIVSLILVTATAVCPLSGPRTPGLVAASTQASSPVGAAAMTAALSAERDGRDPDAEAGYQPLLASADPAVAAEAGLALGRFLERRGRSAAAEAPLKTASAALGNTPDGLEALFLLGEAVSDQRHYGAAAADFQKYIDARGPANGYGQMEEAWALQSAGDDRGALAALLLPLRSTSRSVRQAALAAASQSLERLGDKVGAALDQRELAQDQQPAPDRAAALLAAGRLYHEAADDRTAAASLLTLVQTYPGSTAAGTALDQLDAMGTAVDPLQRAIVLFSLRRNAEAKSAAQAVLDGRQSVAITAKATYYLAALADRGGQNDAAISGYEEAASLDPTGDLAAEALWNRAQLLQSLDRYRDAQSAYVDVVIRARPSDHAADAAFNAGLMAYLDGRLQDAAQLWTRQAQSTDAATSARANLWLGKLALGSGDTAAATDDFKRAQAAQPAGYFGLRAQALAAGSAGVPLRGSAVSPPSPDGWAGVETWLATWAGPEDGAASQGMEAEQDWTEGLALDAFGWQTTPPGLLGDVLARETGRPWALYRAGRALQDRGLTRLAMSAADALLDLAPGSRLAAPPLLLRMDYPLDYLGLVNQDAMQHDLDPLFISALVRQESAFDPAIGSGAGAQGLAQLIPSTAQDVAKTLGLTNFSEADLKRPAVNLQLGTAYLARQAQSQGGDPSRTLAAYNAGGGNADRWARESGGDPDVFYEDVDFEETRLYIRLVSQNYAIYNFLYRGLPGPTLLHP